MAYKYVSYSFTRDEETGFFHKDRVSTEAISLLERWQGAGDGRSYKELKEADDYYQAELMFLVDDQEAAGNQLNAMQKEHGLSREVI